MVASRRRKGGAKDDAKEEKPADKVDTPAKRSESPQRVVRNLVLIALVVITPYYLYLSYLYLRLQSGIERPVVGIDDARQVLIVGTQCAGTSATSELLNDLGIEVSHESTDALNNFARDGTVGWAQAIRFFSSSPDIKHLCTAPRLRLLHSTQFEPSSDCSYRVLWDDCWQKACEDVFERQFGCHRRGCSPGFHKTLLQVRHPVNAVASLVVKYCTTAKAGGLPHPDKLAVLESFFPHIGWRDMRLGCVQVFARYWVEFNSQVLKALESESQEKFDWFRVEDSTPCAVAALAGFTGPSGPSVTAFRKTVDKVQSKCADEDFAPFFSKYHQPHQQVVEHGTVNRVNKGRLKLSWETDFQAQLPDELIQDIQRLALHFGYILSP